MNSAMPSTVSGFAVAHSSIIAPMSIMLLIFSHSISAIITAIGNIQKVTDTIINLLSKV